MITINDNHRKWWIAFAMSACLAMVYLDQTGVALTLENMRYSLNLSVIEVQWVVNAYLLTLAVFMLFGGRLADIFGQKKIFLIGMLIFLLASILCAIASTGWLMIISRALQGLGGAMLIPTSIVLIAQSTSIDERGKMIGFSISLASIFLAFGPTIGGLLTQFWSWRLIFWINLPIGLLSILLTILSISNHSKGDSSKIDWPGFIMLSLSLTSLITAFMQTTTWGFISFYTIILFISFFIFFTIFILIELRSNKPLVNLKLFHHQTFFTGNVILFLLQSCHISSAVFWVLYLQNVLGYSSGKAGVFILPVTIPVIFCASMSGKLLDRYGARLPILLGMFLALSGVVWVAIFATYHNYSLMFIGFLLYGIGAPLVIPAAMTSVLSSVAHEDHGMASGMANSMRQIGGALGLSIIGSVIIAVTNAKLNYHSNVSHHEAFGSAYASAFSVGMIVAALFAFIAFALAFFMLSNDRSKQNVIASKVNYALEEM